MTPEPPDDDAPGMLRRPTTRAAHDRFFEDGEEPPARYDLDDELAYVLRKDFTAEPREWFRVARQRYSACRREFVRNSLLYHIIAFVGYNCVTWVYLIVLDPPLRAGFSIFALGQLTGRRRRYGEFFSGFRRIGRFIVCALPGVGLQLLTFLVLYFGTVATVLSNEYWWGVPVAAAGLALIGTAMFLSVRLTGFAFELVCDYDFDAVQAMRGSWYLTKGHFWPLLGVKLRLWLLEGVVGLLTLGIGLIWLAPYVSLVWTAAYLSIAGSSPIQEPTAACEDTPADIDAEPDVPE